MSDAEKLSCPSGVVDRLDGIPPMQNILKDVDKCNDQAKLQKLSALLDMLTSADVTEEFETFDGLKKMLHLIDSKNKKIAKLTFLILGQYVPRIDKGIHSKLLNMHVFGTLSKTLEDIDSLSYNFAQSSLFLLSSVVSLDKLGQMLARKSKCLHRLIVLFLRILPSLIRNEHWEEERTIRESKGHCETWKGLCLSIKRSIYNPQNKVNQQQVNTIIPKSINFLGDWIHYATENDPLQEFVLSLISLLVQVLFHNQMNQTSFAAYSGISIIVRGLNKFWGLPNLSNSEITNKMIRLLNAAISGHKDNCLLTISLGGMDILLQLLKTLPDNKKFPVIVNLTHLVQKGDENNEKFVKADGLSILAVATVNVDANPAEQHAVSKLLKSWAGKISSYNNQQNKSAENDQPFRDNSLLKLKASIDFDHKAFRERQPTEASQFNENLSTSKKKGSASEKTLSTQLLKKGEEVALKDPIINWEETITHKQSCQMTDNSIHQNILIVDKKESLLITAQNKNEDIVPNALSFGNTKANRETMILRSNKTRNDDENKVGSTLQQLLNTSSCWEMNEENCPDQNTAKGINKKTNQYHKIFPISTNTTCLNDIPKLCSYNGSDLLSGHLSNISSAVSPSRETQEHGTVSPLCLNEQDSRKNLNESSESEYASALDASFDSDPVFSSCNAKSNTSTIIINDVIIDTYEDYIVSSSQESMETQCVSDEILAQKKLDSSFNISTISSGSSSSDYRSKSHKRNGESYANFISKIRRHSGSDFECQLIRHSTPRSKNYKLAKKHSVGNHGRQKILSYQNTSLPPSDAGFSAVTLNSSVASSNKSSNLRFSRQEIDYLEEGVAKFGKNFQSILESSLSTSQ